MINKETYNHLEIERALFAKLSVRLILSHFGYCVSDEDDSDVTCPLCSQSFWFKNQLLDHLKEKHDKHDPTNFLKTRQDNKVRGLPNQDKDISIIEQRNGGGKRPPGRGKIQPCVRRRVC